MLNIISGYWDMMMTRMAIIFGHHNSNDNISVKEHREDDNQYLFMYVHFISKMRVAEL